MSRVLPWTMPDAKMQISQWFLPNDYISFPASKRKMLSEHEWHQSKTGMRSAKPLYIRRSSQASTVLSQIYDLCDRDDTEAALDKILDSIDGFIETDDLHSCDEMLRSVDVELLDIPSILGFLSGTHVVRKKLRTREDFYQTAYLRISRDRPEDVDRLISRFR